MGFYDKPTDANGWYEKGKKYLQSLNFVFADECFSEALKLEPNHMGSLMQRLIVYVMIAKTPPEEFRAYNKADLFSRATGYADELIQLAPNVPEIWNNGGVVFFEAGIFLDNEGKNDEAIRCYDISLEYFENAIKNGAKNPLLWVNRARTFTRLKKYNDAITSYDEAIRIDENMVLAWYYKSKCLDEMGQKEQAKQCLMRAKEIDLNEFKDLADIPRFF